MKPPLTQIARTVGRVTLVDLIQLQFLKCVKFLLTLTDHPSRPDQGPDAVAALRTPPRIALPYVCKLALLSSSLESRFGERVKGGVCALPQGV